MNSLSISGWRRIGSNTGVPQKDSRNNQTESSSASWEYEEIAVAIKRRQVIVGRMCPHNATRSLRFSCQSLIQAGRNGHLHDLSRTFAITVEWI